jgi:hypothetical protein
MGIYATLWVSDKVLRRPVELAWLSDIAENPASIAYPL